MMERKVFRVRNIDTGEIVGYEFFNISLNIPYGCVYTDKPIKETDVGVLSIQGFQVISEPNVIRESYCRIVDKDGLMVFENDIVEYGESKWVIVCSDSGNSLRSLEAHDGKWSWRSVPYYLDRDEGVWKPDIVVAGKIKP